MDQLSITQYLNQESVRKNIEQTLAERASQFIASVSSLVNSDKKFADVDKKSLLSACLIAAALNLPINQSLGFAYIIPYKGVAQFQAGWKAYVQLAQRSGLYKTINVSDVREGEIIGKNRLTGEITFEWCDDEGERAKLAVVGYVAFLQLVNGFEKMLYMTSDELKQHATKYSQAFRANRDGMNLWRDDFDVMARKTVIKLLISKYGPMTTEMTKIQVADQAEIDGDKVRYLDNQPTDADEVAHEKEKARIKKYISTTTSVEEFNHKLEMLEDLVDEYGLRDDLEAKRKELKILTKGKDEAKS